MSDTMTRIRLQHNPNAGFMDWGVQTHEHMVALIKKHAQFEFDRAQAILNADPVEFEVTVVRGPIVQKFVRKVEPK